MGEINDRNGDEAPRKYVNTNASKHIGAISCTFIKEIHEHRVLPDFCIPVESYSVIELKQM